MNYNFDEVIERRGTGSSKWDNVGPRVGNADALPMWVADSDFRCPAPIVEAVKRRADHGIFGYPYQVPEFRKATVDWIERRHGWRMEEEWVTFSTGVVPVLNTMIQAFTLPGEEVIIQRPVYYPFTHAIQDNGRVVSSNTLILKDGRYHIDFDDLERRAKSPKAKMMILCSPHNPVGRVFTAEELRRMGEICVSNNVILISDEIHSDLIYKGYKHVPAASLSPEIAGKTVTCYAPSKTFNIAGLRASGIVTPNRDMRERLAAQFQRNRTLQMNDFAMPGYIAAYTQCEDYLEQMMEYLAGNVTYLDSYLKEKMPKIRLHKPEATYLMWLDCRELGLDSEGLADFWINRCLVAVDRGDWFGPEGEGFARLNIACPRSTLERALTQIELEYKKSSKFWANPRVVF